MIIPKPETGMWTQATDEKKTGKQRGNNAIVLKTYTNMSEFHSQKSSF